MSEAEKGDVQQLGESMWTTMMVCFVLGYTIGFHIAAIFFLKPSRLQEARLIGPQVRLVQLDLGTVGRYERESLAVEFLTEKLIKRIIYLVRAWAHLNNENERKMKSEEKKIKKIIKTRRASLDPEVVAAAQEQLMLIQERTMGGGSQELEELALQHLASLNLGRSNTLYKGGKLPEDLQANLAELGLDDDEPQPELPVFQRRVRQATVKILRDVDKSRQQTTASGRGAGDQDSGSFEARIITADAERALADLEGKLTTAKTTAVTAANIDESLGIDIQQPRNVLPGTTK